MNIEDVALPAPALQAPAPLPALPVAAVAPPMATSLVAEKPRLSEDFSGRGPDPCGANAKDVHLRSPFCFGVKLKTA